VKRKTFEIIATSMQMLGGSGSPSDDRKSYGPPEHSDDDFVHESAEDDIPL
jgi:hypothetical protein